MNRQQKMAQYSGYSLIIMALTAGFSFGFVLPKVFNKTQSSLALENITENLSLYKYMVAGILLVILLDVIVSYTLFQYFKKDNKDYAMSSFVFRIIYTLIFLGATYFLIKNISETDNSNVIANYTSFEFTWALGLIVFGIHLLFIGVLMKLHKAIPKTLWYLTIIAGASYILVHVLKTAFPHLTELTDTLNKILALPMALGELGLAVWLVLKGGKSENK